MSGPTLSVFCARHAGISGFRSFKQHLLETCGLPPDKVFIEEWPARSGNLSRHFNESIGGAAGDYVCLLSDDLSFEMAPGWARKLAGELERDPRYGVLGVAGASVLPEDGDWRHAEVSCGQVHERRGGVIRLVRYGAPRSRIVPAAALDGVFLFARTESIRDLRLDEERFDGLLFFDMELSMQAASLGVRLGVTGAIDLVHIDPPERGDAWERARVRFLEKHGTDLPANALAPSDLLPFSSWTCGTEGGNSVAILIPVKDHVDRVRAAVSAVQSRTPRRVPSMIYLLDEGSSPASLSELRDLPGTRLLEAGGSDFAAAHNDLLLGDDLIREDLILFHDGDVEMVNDVLSHLLQAWESTPRAGVVSARVHFGDGLIDEAGRSLARRGGKDVLLERPGRLTLWSFDGATVRGGTGGSFAMALMDRCLFVHLGGFREGCGRLEAEVEMGLKAVAAGRTNVQTGDAVAVRAEGLTGDLDTRGERGITLLAPEIAAFVADHIEALGEWIPAVEAAPGSGPEREGEEAPRAPVELFDDPNRYARQPGIETGDAVVVHGYQEYRLDREGVMPLPVDAPLERKRCLVERFYQEDALAGKSLLDLGANGGFFSIWARQRGAAGVTALDMDEKYLDLIRRAQEHAGLDRIRTVARRVQDWDEPADIVLAFALVHWLYSCTAAYGSLEAVVLKLSDLTRDLLIVEWVAPEDPAIAFFRHTDWNPAAASGPYTREAFEAALRGRFARIEILGEINPTRILYAAYRQAQEISPSPELPLLAPRERLLSARCLTELDGVRYHSAVYREASKGTVLKQTTGNLAWHEAEMLRRLGGPFFPRLLSARCEEDSSVAVMEWIDGEDLTRVARDVACRPKRLASFLADGIEILALLRAARIRHRDIRIENFRVRGGRPVLIDFGWAEADEIPYLTPEALGGSGRPPDGRFCDVYSMGDLFKRLVPSGHAPLFAPLVRPMTEPWPTRRQTDPAILRNILLGLALPRTWDSPAEAQSRIA